MSAQVCRMDRDGGKWMTAVRSDRKRPQAPAFTLSGARPTLSSDDSPLGRFRRTLSWS